MSMKRTATTDLNHENWDQDEPSDKEEMGQFKAATKDVLEKRVIRTAKRRAPISSDEPKKSAFSGFGGFNKVQPSSFDFLANLTNGSKNQNGTKSDTTITSSLFTSKPATTPSSGLFSLPPTSSAKPAFGTTPTSPFTTDNKTATVSSGPNTEVLSMIFSSSKADSTVGDSPFKMQSVSSSADSNVNSGTSQVSSTLFGVSSTSTNQKSSLLSNISSKQPVSSTTTAVQNSTAVATSVFAEKSSVEKEKENARNKYYSKLKGLNISVSSWITKHVEKTPLCFLSPIFRDYENYLKVIQEEYDAAKKEIDDKATPIAPEKKSFGYKDLSPPTSPAANNSSSAQEVKSNTPLFCLNSKTTTTASAGIFGGTSTNSESSSKTSTPAKGFSFGVSPASNMPPTPVKTETSASPSQGFSFGIESTTGNKQSIFTTATTSPVKGFSFGSASTASSPVSSSLFSSSTTGTPAKGISFGVSTPAVVSPTNTEGNSAPGAAPFSFGISGSKPFSFSPQTQQSTTETKPAEEEEDQPPKVEFTPVVEENCVYDKKCKIFVKKDGNFIDKGIGTLYIKKIEESGKHQLLVRANTNLGTILINLILSSGVPTQRMGKNNVMLVGIPTPDSNPPPTPVLIRVKTGDEADQLLETLNKYKS